MAAPQVAPLKEMPLHIEAAFPRCLGALGGIFIFGLNPHSK